MAHKKHNYIVIKTSNHPFADKKGNIKKHRLIMEEYLRKNKPDHIALIIIEFNNKFNKYLSPDYIVHHENGIIDDNRIENLSVMLASEHIRGHRLGQKTSEATKKKMSKAHIGKTFPQRQGLSLAELGHESDCKCCMCKAFRGELTEKNNPFFGHHQSKKNRQISVDVNLGKKASQDTKDKMSESHKKRYKKKPFDSTRPRDKFGHFIKKN